MHDEKEYDKFVTQLETDYPKIFSQKYGGIAISPGWWPIIRSLCSQIQSHIDYVNNTNERLQDSNPHNLPIPEKVTQVVVEQIKEKFGGLRFYYQGGNNYIDGMVRMAEIWADHTCEECGAPGQKRNQGWITTLCDFHVVEKETLRSKEMRENGFEE